MPFAPDARLARLSIGFAAALIAAFAQTALAQEPKPAQPSAVPTLEQRIETFVTRLEARRRELGVVGASLVIAQGDRILRIAGLGLRQMEPPLPVTEDTVFMIASATKQFTGMAVALAVGEGKMAFEDHPRRFVPEFRLKDPEADAKLNIIDLLAHRSGVARSDVGFLYLPFTQAEMFALAYRATPAAKPREQFIYNNTMYSLAGAALARAYGTTYERFMSERILNPLGMRSTTLTLAELLASPNHAKGYAGSTASDRKAVKPVNAAAIAPAGAINSSARDMGAWLRFLNARGQAEGVKVAPAAYARVFERHQSTGGRHYGMGFYLETRSGVLLVEHGGNLPGFSAQVVHVPDRALSLALLTNQDNSLLANVALELFWDMVVKPELPDTPAPRTEKAPPPPTSGRAIAPDQLVGQYFASEDVSFDVKKIDSGLVLIPPGAPAVPMKEAAVNYYDLEGSGGYALRFAESDTMSGRVAAFLHRPPTQGDPIPLLKKDEAWLARARAQHAGPNAELIGSYHSADRKVMMEIVPFRDGVALNIVGEALRVLVGAGGDLFRFEGRPDTDRLAIKRSGSGNVVGFTLEAPNSRREMIGEGSASAKEPDRAREILERAVAAVGGAEALDRISSVTAIGRASAAAHGFEGRVEDRGVPGKKATFIELGAFGKFLKIQVVTNERSGSSLWIDGERYPIAGKNLEVSRVFGAPHPLYRWKERFVSVAALGETVVNGENAFVIELTPAGLAPSKVFISAQSFLVLRQEMPTYVGEELQEASVADFSDHRMVDGLRLPFALTFTMPILGEVVLTFERMTLGEIIDPKNFE